MPAPRPRAPRAPRVSPTAAQPWVTDDLLDDGVDDRLLEGESLADADLTTSSVVASMLRHCVLDGADLSRTHLVDSLLDGCEATAFRAPRSTWRSCEIRASRFGAVELYE